MNDAFERAAVRAEEAAREHQRRRRSRGQRTAFRIHATVFVAVQVLIVAIWALTWAVSGDSYPWFVYPLLGWGVGLAAHYAAARESIRR